MTKNLFLLLITTLVLGSCARFQGPGSYQGPEFQPPEPNALKHGKHRAYKNSLFQLDWPVKTAKLTQKYKPHRGRPHHGIDLAAPYGTVISSAHPGRVIFAGSSFRGYGRMVIVEYNGQWASLYAHLAKILVKEGEHIPIGGTIGTMGRSGRATGVHLHFELLRHKKPVDPLNHLPQDAQQLVQGR